MLPHPAGQVNEQIVNFPLQIAPNFTKKIDSKPNLGKSPCPATRSGTKAALRPPGAKPGGRSFGRFLPRGGQVLPYRLAQVAGPITPSAFRLWVSW